jgi:hypothetical protein
MRDQRERDRDWLVVDRTTGRVPTWERVAVAVLMDIRDELGKLNAAIYCPNFVAIPRTLQRISKNTAKPKRKTR